MCLVLSNTFEHRRPYISATTVTENGDLAERYIFDVGRDPLAKQPTGQEWVEVHHREFAPRLAFGGFVLLDCR
jgi:hypothetical protein